MRIPLLSLVLGGVDPRSTTKHPQIIDVRRAPEKELMGSPKIQAVPWGPVMEVSSNYGSLGPKAFGHTGVVEHSRS